MEQAIYELRPYFFLSVSLSALTHSEGSKLMLFSSIMLLAAASLVIYSRLKHRGYLERA